jgi:hypothetical protein
LAKDTAEAAVMTRTSFEQAMQAFLQRKPFRPFVIEFDDGRQWVVGQPEALFYHTGDTAVYFRPDESFDFVDSEAVKQLLELTTVPAV